MTALMIKDTNFAMPLEDGTSRTMKTMAQTFLIFFNQVVENKDQKIRAYN